VRDCGIEKGCFLPDVNCTGVWDLMDDVVDEVAND